MGHTIANSFLKEKVNNLNSSASNRQARSLVLSLQVLGNWKKWFFQILQRTYPLKWWKIFPKNRYPKKNRFSIKKCIYEFLCFLLKVSNNMHTLQTCLTSMMGRPITMDQLRQDVGLMVEKITYVTLMFRRIKLRAEEYVCLKVITMLTQGEFSNVQSMPTTESVDVVSKRSNLEVRDSHKKNTRKEWKSEELSIRRKIERWPWTHCAK